MGLGAIFAALNTMYSAVSARSARDRDAARDRLRRRRRRRLGARRNRSLLSLIGASIGAAISWLLFNGNTVTLGDSVVVAGLQDAGDARPARRRHAVGCGRRPRRRAVPGCARRTFARRDGVASRLVGRQRAALAVAALLLLREQLDLIDRGRRTLQQRALQEPRPDERR